MNREIKFRAWDGEDMITQSVRKDYDDYYTMDLDGTFYGHTRTGDEDFVPEKSIENNKNYVLMQYTGLKDKNGTEIYEGDIVECYDHPTGIASTTGQVMFVNGYYNVHGGYALHDYGTAWTEIKGNIYENPELIKTA